MFRLRINFFLAREKTKISLLQEQKEKEVITRRETKTAPGTCEKMHVQIYAYSIYTLQRLTKCSSEENVFHSAVLRTFNFEVQEVKKILKISKGSLSCNL